MCVLLLVFIISLYNFTLGYQVPLVMEQVMTEFSQKLEQNTDLEQYKQILLDRDLIDTDFQAISETIWNRPDLKKEEIHCIDRRTGL